MQLVSPVHAVRFHCRPMTRREVASEWLHKARKWAVASVCVSVAVVGLAKEPEAFLKGFIIGVTGGVIAQAVKR